MIWERKLVAKFGSRSEGLTVLANPVHLTTAKDREVGVRRVVTQKRASKTHNRHKAKVDSSHREHNRHKAKVDSSHREHRKQHLRHHLEKGIPTGLPVMTSRRGDERQMETMMRRPKRMRRGRSCWMMCR